MRQIVEAFGIKPQFDTNTIPKNLVSFIHTLHVHLCSTTAATTNTFIFPSLGCVYNEGI